MNTTRRLPTDKHGNVYYGPRSAAEAADAIEEVRVYAKYWEQYARIICRRMDRAGFTGVARRIRKHFGV